MWKINFVECHSIGGQGGIHREPNAIANSWLFAHINLLTYPLSFCLFVCFAHFNLLIFSLSALLPNRLICTFLALLLTLTSSFVHYRQIYSSMAQFRGKNFFSVPKQRN